MHAKSGGFATALFYAANKGCYELSKQLLEKYGAIPNPGHRRDGATSEGLARKAGHSDLAGGNKRSALLASHSAMSPVMLQSSDRRSNVLFL